MIAREIENVTVAKCDNANCNSCWANGEELLKTKTYRFQLSSAENHPFNFNHDDVMRLNGERQHTSAYQSKIPPVRRKCCILRYKQDMYLRHL